MRQFPELNVCNIYVYVIERCGVCVSYIPGAFVCVVCVFACYCYIFDRVSG